MPISPQQYSIRIGSFIENRNKKIKYKYNYSNYKSKYKKMHRIVIPLLLLSTFGCIMNTVCMSDKHDVLSLECTHSHLINTQKYRLHSTSRPFSDVLLTLPITQVCSSGPGRLHSHSTTSMNGQQMVNHRRESHIASRKGGGKVDFFI